MAMTHEQIRSRIEPWIAPIRPEAPGGAQSRELPAYQRVVTEVEKLESPSGGAVSWKLVVEEGGELLKSQSKDLRVASYFAFGLQATQGLAGLLSGMALLSELLETYWLTLFPEPTRIRGRASAIAWFIERTKNALAGTQPTSADREVVEALWVAANRLVEVSKKTFGAEGPALNPLMETIERLKLSLPAETPPAAAPSALPTPSAPSAPTDTANPEALLAYAREVGTQLAGTAQVFRRAKPDDGLAYRLLRTGLWLPMMQVPAKLAGPPTPLREKLEKLASNAKWPELLDEAESALSHHRLWLDLNRYSAQALAGLGHAAARATVVGETASLLRRLPGLAAFQFAEGAAAADGATREWIDTELNTGGGGGPVRPRLERPKPKPVADADALLREGKAAEALALLQENVGIATDASTRFEARLALAEAYVTSGQTDVARGLYAALDLEGQNLQLDSWNPSLAAKCLQGLLLATRQIKKSRPPLEAEWDAQYKRLCLIDPSAAARVGP